jgi:hypothetical protein
MWVRYKTTMSGFAVLSISTLDTLKDYKIGEEIPCQQGQGTHYSYSYFMYFFTNTATLSEHGIQNE